MGTTHPYVTIETTSLSTFCALSFFAGFVTNQALSQLTGLRRKLIWSAIMLHFTFFTLAVGSDPDA